MAEKRPNNTASRPPIRRHVRKTGAEEPRGESEVAQSRPTAKTAALNYGSEVVSGVVFFFVPFGVPTVQRAGRGADGEQFFARVFCRQWSRIAAAARRGRGELIQPASAPTAGDTCHATAHPVRCGGKRWSALEASQENRCPTQELDKTPH